MRWKLGRTVTAHTPTGDVRRDARWRSLRRAGRLFSMSPVGVLLSVPDVFHANGMDSITEFYTPISRLGTLLFDVKGALIGDPLVIFATVLEKFGDEYPEKVTGCATFGYLLNLDIKRAVRIARDGQTRDAPDRIESDALVRTTRHVYRQTTVREDVILLCNSARTAIALESEIQDAALISALRGPPTKDSATNA